MKVSHRFARARYVAVADDEHATAENPAARVVLVYERIIQWIGQAIVLNDRGESADAQVDKALNAIEQGLRPWIDHRRGGDFSRQLVSLYDWIERQLLLFRLRRDTEVLREVLDVLLTLQEGWKGLVDPSGHQTPPAG